MIYIFKTAWVIFVYALSPFVISVFALANAIWSFKIVNWNDIAELRLFRFYVDQNSKSRAISRAFREKIFYYKNAWQYIIDGEKIEEVD